MKLWRARELAGLGERRSGKVFAFTFFILWKRVRMIDDSLHANSVKPRLGVIGSGAGSNMGALAAAMERGEVHAEIVLVISDVADAGILTKARSQNIAAHFVDPGPYKNRLSDEAQEKMAALLKEARVDFVICAGFMRRLKEPVLLAFPQRILNVHHCCLSFPGGMRSVRRWRPGFRKRAAQCIW